VAAWTLILIGWAFAIVMMTALWAVQRARNDAGVVDVGWAAGLGVIAIIYAVLAGGAWPHRLLVSCLVSPKA
jgi:steroid 5-alpha reductase family enzyme